MFTVCTHIAPVNVLIITLLHNPSSWRQFIFLTNNSITTVSGSPAQSPSFLPMWYLQSKECPCPAVQSLTVCLFWPSCGHRLTVRSLVWWEWGKQRRQSLCCHHTLHYCTALHCALYTTSHCTYIVIYWYWQILPIPRKHRSYSSYTGHHLLDMATLLHCIPSSQICTMCTITTRSMPLLVLVYDILISP